MMEHYRTAWGDLQNVFTQHLGTILAPIDALVGPFKALGKGMFIMTKALFTGPTAYEKSVVQYLKKIAGHTENTDDTAQLSLKERAKNWVNMKIWMAKLWLGFKAHQAWQKAQALWEKKRWFKEKKDAIKEKAREFYGKAKTGAGDMIGKIIQGLIRFGPILKGLCGRG